MLEEKSDFDLAMDDTLKGLLSVIEGSCQLCFGCLGLFWCGAKWFTVIPLAVLVGLLGAVWEFIRLVWTHKPMRLFRKMGYFSWLTLLLTSVVSTLLVVVYTMSCAVLCVGQGPMYHEVCLLESPDEAKEGTGGYTVDPLTPKISTEYYISCMDANRKEIANLYCETKPVYKYNGYTCGDGSFVRLTKDTVQCAVTSVTVP